MPTGPRAPPRCRNRRRRLPLPRPPRQSIRPFVRTQGATCRLPAAPASRDVIAASLLSFQSRLLAPLRPLARVSFLSRAHVRHAALCCSLTAHVTTAYARPLVPDVCPLPTRACMARRAVDVIPPPRVCIFSGVSPTSSPVASDGLQP
ncbi:hypothetical protein MSAN_01980600 [Mycena sanguinolenta]|uniref:Uncharacterized protein n=1 Tax=Mycena sanguinolenta TaxID=230812 RepID=A0A8H7CPK1_9AGAR|nr:hypothetical protein MSAN_01980600 [Mycena sanguinolenta]